MKFLLAIAKLIAGKLNTFIALCEGHVVPIPSELVEMGAPASLRVMLPVDKNGYIWIKGKPVEMMQVWKRLAVYWQLQTSVGMIPAYREVEVLSETHPVIQAFIESEI